MSRLTVKPMPPSRLRPKTSLHVRLSSSSARVNLLTRNVLPKMPTALPSTSPAMTPIVTASVSVSVMLVPTTVTPVEKNAKTGTAKPAE